MSQATTQSGQAVTLRQAAIRAAAAVAILGLAYGTVRGLEAMMNAVFDKPPAPLQNPLPMMATELAHYSHEGTDEVLNPEMQESLGTSDYLIRRFRERTSGQLVNLNVNYYATGTSTPHVPEICWKGTGMKEVGKRLFTVEGLKRKDGSGKLSDVTMRMVSFEPPNGPATNEKGEPIYSNVAYVFQVNDMYVAGTQEVTSLFWKAQYRYAYHAKIEVTPWDLHNTKQPIMICTPAEAERIIKDFMREVLPEVEKCLPDPAILTSPEAETSTQPHEQR